MKPKWAILILAVAVAGCKESTEPVSPAAFIHPENDGEVNPCCINFKWETSYFGNYYLSISPNADFTTMIVDTMLLLKNVYLCPDLQPSVTYYWRIRMEDTETTASFTVKDVAVNFQGYHIVTINKQFWCDGCNPYHQDTAFLDTIYLIKESDGLRFTYGHYNYRLEHQSPCVSDRVVYALPGQDQDHSKEVYLDYLSDSLFAAFREISPDSGEILNLSGKVR